MLESKLAWPELVARRKGITFHTGNTVIYPTDAAFRGTVLATPKVELKLQARRYLDWVRSEKPYKTLFDHDITVRAVKSYSGKGKERTPNFVKMKLDEMTPAIYMRTLEHYVRDKHKSYNLIRVEGQKVWGARLPKTGPIIVGGKVKSVSHGGRGESSTYNNVSLTGPFTKSKQPFSAFNSDSHDFTFSFDKQGYDKVMLIDIYGGALLDLLTTRPTEVINYMNLKRAWPGAEFWSPIFTRKARKWKGELPYVSDRERDLTFLKHDILVNYYMRSSDEKMNLFGIDKICDKIPSIFHPYVAHLLKGGDASWQVIVNEYPFSVDSMQYLDTPMQGLVNSIHKKLEESGYKHSGYVLEKEGTPFETVAELFMKPDQTVVYEVLWNKEIPPVIIKREYRNDSKFVPWTSNKSDEHPFNDLHVDGKDFVSPYDMRETQYTVVLPPSQGIEPFAKQYREAIDKHFPEGFELFEKVLTNGSAPATKGNASEKLATIRLLKNAAP